MKSFQCKVERESKFIVEFDEAVCDEEWMERFRRSFFDYYTLEEHAEHISSLRAKRGPGFIEGYGVPLENGEAPYWAEEDEINKSINIKSVSELEYCDVTILKK